MGPVTAALERMGFLVCIDGVPAFHGKRKGSPSLMPAELINLSLPPHLRYDPDNMMCWMLIPASMSTENQMKYFEYVIKTELNPLYTHGVTGPDGAVKIKLFGASLDLKGKEKFYNQVHLLCCFVHSSTNMLLCTKQVTVTGYCGCSTCAILYDKGPSGPMYTCARRFLPDDHPLRSTVCEFKGYHFHYHNEETRSEPRLKTTQTLFNYATLAEERGVTHYLGQKGPPLLASLDYFKYEKFNILEWMHNLKRTFECFLDLLVGRDKQFDEKARKTSRQLGLFREIWSTKHLSQVHTLSQLPSPHPPLYTLVT